MPWACYTLRADRLRRSPKAPAREIMRQNRRRTAPWLVGPCSARSQHQTCKGQRSYPNRIQHTRNVKQHTAQGGVPANDCGKICYAARPAAANGRKWVESYTKYHHMGFRQLAAKGLSCQATSPAATSSPTTAPPKCCFFFLLRRGSDQDIQDIAPGQDEHLV